MAQNSTLMQLRAQSLGIQNEDNPNSTNRYFGGHRRRNHPLISGYWYLILVPPEKLMADNVPKAVEWFHATAESFTPPTRTLTKVDVPGMGGQASSYVAGQELTRTFTVAFREYRDMPIMQLINMWTAVMDSHWGLSPLKGEDWIPESYKGYCYAFLTKPTGHSIMNSYSNGGNVSTITEDDIDQVFFFEGVFPEAPPFDTLNSDISTNDVVQHSVTFSFDGFPLTKEHNNVLSKALSEWNEWIGQFIHKDELDVDTKTDYSQQPHTTWGEAGVSDEGTL